MGLNPVGASEIFLALFVTVLKVTSQLQRSLSLLFSIHSSLIWSLSYTLHIMCLISTVWFYCSCYHYLLILTLSIPSSQYKFSQLFKNKMIEWCSEKWLFNQLSSEPTIYCQILHTVWYISLVKDWRRKLKLIIHGSERVNRAIPSINIYLITIILLNTGDIGWSSVPWSLISSAESVTTTNVCTLQLLH